ncbi:MAG: BamA/TamA family outer membrane protein [Bacteroidales bacterium]|nr:BamA/TamA family outer membrane protein [Bacteroidales bacterium]
MKRWTGLIICLAVVSCSTTKLVPEGEYRLTENKVVILNSGSFNSSDLVPYIKQKPNDYYIGRWNPFLYVYNWSSGNDTGWDKFVEKLGVKPVIFDSTLIDGSKKGMLSHLEYLGYYNSDISNVTDKNNKKARVRYDVTLGKRYPIHDINYVVRDSMLVKIIAKDSANCTINRGDALSQDALENESERLATLFKNNGYYGFTKNFFFYFADTTRVQNMADLTVKLEDYTRNESASTAKPHIQYYIGDVEIIPQGGFKVRKKFLNNLNTIEPGNLYREKDVNTTYERFSSVRLFSTVNVELQESDSAKVDCRILLSPSKLQGIKLNLEGSFNSTGLFGITPSLSYSHKNIFHGGEELSLGFSGNFQFKFNDPTRSTEFAISTALTFPQFLLLPASLFKTTLPQTNINFTYNYQNRPEYTRNIISTAYGYRWSMRKNFHYQIYPLQMNVVRIFNMSPDFYEKLNDPYLINAYQNHFDFGAGTMFYYTTDASINPKHSYFYLRWQSDLAGNLLSLFNKAMSTDESGSHLIWGIPYSQYVRTEISAVTTIKFGSSNQFAVAGRALAGFGYAYGNSSVLPFEKFFYAGGANSMRGWQSRSVGPGMAPLDQTFSIANQTGDMHLEANIEFRFPIFWKLQGGLFVDAGNVWNLPRGEIDGQARDPLSLFYWNNCLKTTALDWGAGIRLDFNMLLVRLDLGIKTYDPSSNGWQEPSLWLKKGGYAIHFGIGYPF